MSETKADRGSLARVPDLRTNGWTLRVEHGGDVATLHYADQRIAVEHECTRPRDGMTLLIAPFLTVPGHVIVQGNPLTIRPSILCADCGLHGYMATLPMGCGVAAERSTP